MAVSEPTTSRWLSGNFAPVHEEVTAVDLAVTGSLPPQLDGRYLRIGPNPIGPTDPRTYHWFLGSGMVHGIRLRHGRAEWYRNRYVRTSDVSVALGEPAIPGERHGDTGDTVNTNVIGIAGRTFALVEAGSRPVELSDDLDSLRVSDLDGTLPNGYTAHPKVDPLTCELHAIAYNWALPFVQYLVITPQARVRRCVPIAVADGPMIHDMALTQRFAIVLDLPCTFSLEAVAEGASFPYVWNPAHPARLGLVPREGAADGSDVRWFDLDPCYVYHPLNAYDDGDLVVIDVVRHPSTFDTNRLGPDEGPPALWRWTVDLVAGTVRATQIDDRPQEFPRVDERVVSLPHRFGYSAAVAEGFVFDGNALLRHDLERGTTEARELGARRGGGEPVFVPASPDAAEDDGFVLALVYDAERDGSDLLVLNSRDFLGDPAAVVHLPARVPYGFHGSWVPTSGT